MYDGYQVLRFANNYKSKDLYLIGNEMNNRVGTGNYDKERTKFNIKYKELEKDNLYQDVKYKLESRNIEYLHKSKTNILNGVTISSGPEFFMTLGLPFKETDRKYKSGKKEGQNILVPDIKSENDIPAEVCSFFVESYEFLKNMVGEENIVMAQIHFDEDTPHLQAYFLPVVNEVKRKVFELDENGHQLKHEITNKKGEKKLVPIQKKDKNGNNIYETVKGKFLNSDQFWKQKGGNASYTLLQDDYNEFIKSKGYNLFRGEIGGDKTHLTNAMKQQKELNALNKEIRKENELLKEANKAENRFIDKVDKEISKDILNPIKKGIIKQYKDEDIDNLSTYSKELAEDNIKKDLEIKLLTKEVNDFKSGKTYKEQNRIIDSQKKIISEKDNEINIWKNKFEEITNEFKMFKKKIQNKIFSLTSKIFDILHIPYTWYEANDIDFAIDKTNSYLKKHSKSKDDFER